MAYSVPAAPNFGTDSYTITGVIQLLSGQNPPASIAFSALKGPSIGLTTGLGAPIQFNPSTSAVVRAVGLLSCASFCFVNGSSSTAYVFHGNVGVLPQSEFDAAMQEIGAPPYGAVYVAVAHPGPTGVTYQESIADMVTWGVPTNNIVEITDMTAMDSFGLNNLFQIGY